MWIEAAYRTDDDRWSKARLIEVPHAIRRARDDELLEVGVAVNGDARQTPAKILKRKHVRAAKLGLSKRKYRYGLASILAINSGDAPRARRVLFSTAKLAFSPNVAVGDGWTTGACAIWADNARAPGSSARTEKYPQAAIAATRATSALGRANVIGYRLRHYRKSRQPATN